MRINYTVPWRVLYRRPATFFLCGLVRGYQLTLSPFLGWHCRHQPSCSNYMLEALVVHGAAYGFWLGLKRVLRCNPFGSCGIDPVPQRSNDKQK